MTLFIAPGFGSGGSSNLSSNAAVLLNSSTPSYTATTIDLNRTDEVTNDQPWGLFNMPAANSNGFTAGSSHINVYNNPGSWPLRVRNGGTLGTDAVLEAIVRPGSQAVFGLADNTGKTVFGLTPSAAAGTWNKQAQCFDRSSDEALMKMLAPCAPGIAPQRYDLGGTSVFGTQSTKSPTQVMLTSTLGAFIYTNNSNAIVVEPFQCSTDGLTTQVLGTPTVVASGSGSTVEYQYAHAAKISATQLLITAWDAGSTATPRNVFLVVNIVPGTLPSAPSVGTTSSLTDDTGIATSTNRIITPGKYGSSLIADNGGPNFWYVGFFGTSSTWRYRAYYLTVNTGTPSVTLSANLDYDSSKTFSTQNAAQAGIVPCSTGAAKCLVTGNAAGRFFVLSYSGGAITALGSILNVQGTPGLNYTSAAPVWLDGLLRIEAIAQGYYLICGVVANPFTQQSTNGPSYCQGQFSIVKFDLVNYDVISVRNVNILSLMDDADPAGSLAVAYPGTSIHLGDGEFLSIALSGSPEVIAGPQTGAILSTYVDFKTYFRAGNPMPALLAQLTADVPTGLPIATPETIIGRTYAVEFMGGSVSGLSGSIGVDVTTRRVTLVVNDNEVSSGNYGLRVGLFEFPKR